jgi:hypothetical protein
LRGLVVGAVCHALTEPEVVQPFRPDSKPPLTNPVGAADGLFDGTVAWLVGGVVPGASTSNVYTST